MKEMKRGTRILRGLYPQWDKELKRNDYCLPIDVLCDTLEIERTTFIQRLEQQNKPRLFLTDDGYVGAYNGHWNKLLDFDTYCQSKRLPSYEIEDADEIPEHLYHTTHVPNIVLQNGLSSMHRTGAHLFSYEYIHLGRHKGKTLIIDARKALLDRMIRCAYSGVQGIYLIPYVPPEYISE